MQLSSDTLRFSLHTLLLAMVVASIALGCLSLLKQAFDKNEAEYVRLARLHKQALEQAVQETEAVRQMLGRTPESQAELEAILEQSLPTAYEDGHALPIRYSRLDGRHYQLRYSSFWTYDSRTPAAGWVQRNY